METRWGQLRGLVPPLPPSHIDGWVSHGAKGLRGHSVLTCDLGLVGRGVGRGHGGGEDGGGAATKRANQGRERPSHPCVSETFLALACKS